MKLRHFNIMRILYCLVLALPFVAILSRVIYVQSNKNAYQNYSGSNEIQYNDVANINDIKIGNKYLFNSQLGVYSDSTTKNTNVIFYDDITNINTQNNNLLTYLEQGNNFRFYYSTEPIAIYVYDNQTAIGNIAVNSNYPLTFEFTIENYNTTDLSNNFSFLKEIYLSNNFNLDNVFEYSVNNFIDDNNFGRVNLFEWTTDLFFDDNEVNNMYVHYVNWYLNYVLLMSTTYILFLVLMWFVNYSRRLLERGMNYDW